MEEAASKWGLYCHFYDSHPLNSVLLLGEGGYPNCVACGMQTDPYRIMWDHKDMQLCWDSAAQRHQLRARTDEALTLWQQFVVNRDVLDWVEVFKYLGRFLSQDDDDTRAVQAQAVKAHMCWARFGKVLRSKNTSPRVYGYFYKAVV